MSRRNACRHKNARELEVMMTQELQALAGHIAGRIPRGWGFTLTIGPFHSDDGDQLYVSNCDRESVIKMLRTMAPLLEDGDG